MNMQLLKEVIKSKGMTPASLSREIGIDKVTMYRRLQEKVDFTLSEVKNIKKVLNLNEEAVHDIFFSNKVS